MTATYRLFGVFDQVFLIPEGLLAVPAGSAHPLSSCGNVVMGQRR